MAPIQKKVKTKPIFCNTVWHIYTNLISKRTDFLMLIRFRSPWAQTRDLKLLCLIYVRMVLSLCGLELGAKLMNRFLLNSHQIYNNLSPNWRNRSYLGNFQKSTLVYPKIYNFSKCSVVISFWGPPFNNKPKQVSDNLFGALGTIQTLDATILSCTTCTSISISFTVTTV